MGFPAEFLIGCGEVTGAVSTILLYSRKAKWGGRKTENKLEKSWFDLLDSEGLKSKPLEISKEKSKSKLDYNSSHH